MLWFIDIRQHGSGGKDYTLYFDSVNTVNPLFYQYKPLLEPYERTFWTCMGHYTVLF